jgi:WD40 repeat protein
VIEGADGLGRRLGILDMNTREILKWFDLEHPVASVAWSPDGTKVLATAYSSSPDLLEGEGDQAGPTGSSPRTGYYLVDVRAGTADFHPLPVRDADTMNARQDFGWSLDGTLIWAPVVVEPGKLFFTLDGRERPAPEGEQYVWGTGHSAISPDGRLLLGPAGLPTKIFDVATREIAGRQNVLQLHAWADDDNVLALGCAGSCDNEFNNGLVLVSVDGERTTQLSRNRNTQENGAWRWVLTPR